MLPGKCDNIYDNIYIYQPYWCITEWNVRKRANEKNKRESVNINIVIPQWATGGTCPHCRALKDKANIADHTQLISWNQAVIYPFSGVFWWMYMLNAYKGADLKDKHREIMKTKKNSQSLYFTQQILKDKKKQSKSILISFRSVQKPWRGFAISFSPHIWATSFSYCLLLLRFDWKANLLQRIGTFQPSDHDVKHCLKAFKR